MGTWESQCNRDSHVQKLWRELFSRTRTTRLAARMQLDFVDGSACFGVLFMPPTKIGGGGTQAKPGA